MVVKKAASETLRSMPHAAAAFRMAIAHLASALTLTFRRPRLLGRAGVASHVFF